MFCVLINLSLRDWEPSGSFAFSSGPVGSCGDVSWVSPLYYCFTCVSATPRSSRLVQDISVCTDPPTQVCLRSHTVPHHSISMLLYNTLIFDTLNKNMNLNHYTSCYTIVMVCTSWLIIWFLNIRASEEPKLKLCLNKSLRYLLFAHVIWEMWYDVP